MLLTDRLSGAARRAIIVTHGAAVIPAMAFVVDAGSRLWNTALRAPLSTLRLSVADHSLLETLFFSAAVRPCRTRSAYRGLMPARALRCCVGERPCSCCCGCRSSCGQRWSVSMASTRTSYADPTPSRMRAVLGSIPGRLERGRGLAACRPRLPSRHGMTATLPRGTGPVSESDICWSGTAARARLTVLSALADGSATG